MRFCVAAARFLRSQGRERRVCGWEWGLQRERKRVPGFPLREGVVLWFPGVAAGQRVRFWLRFGECWGVRDGAL